MWYDDASGRLFVAGLVLVFTLIIVARLLIEDRRRSDDDDDR